MRYDLSVVAAWVEPGARVLDLGCGRGDLLAHLREHKQVVGRGIEIEEDKAEEAIARGLSVLHGDLTREIADYPDRSFDYVILSQTLQQVYDPAGILREMLRVGARGIVSFPNFSHWGIRLQLLLTGVAPVSQELPYGWHDTPNIRVITLKDFRRFCQREGVAVEREVAISSHHHEERGRQVSFLANLRATYGIYLLSRRSG